MKKTKPSALESLKQSLAKADETLKAAKAARASLTQTLAEAPSVEAAPPQPGRVDGLPCWSRSE